jgi:O-antigen ligase
MRKNPFIYLAWTLPLAIFSLVPTTGVILDVKFGMADMFGRVNNLSVINLYLMVLLMPLLAIRLGRKKDAFWYLSVLALFAITTINTHKQNPDWAFGSTLHLTVALSVVSLGTGAFLISRYHSSLVSTIPTMIIVVTFMTLPLTPLLFALADPTIQNPSINTSGYGNIRAYGQLAAMVSAALIGIQFSRVRDNDLLRMIYPTLLMTCAWVIVFWSGSRAAMLALTLATVICTAAFCKNKVLLMVIALPPAVGAMLSMLIYNPSTSFGLLNRINKTANGIDSGNMSVLTSRRFDLWPQILDFIRESPIIGHGYRPLPKLDFDDYVINQAHNIVLEYWAAFGIPLGSCLCAAILFYSISAIRHAIYDGSSRAVSSMAVIITFLTMSMFSGIYMSPISMAGFAVCLGGLLGLKASKNQGDYSAS